MKTNNHQQLAREIDSIFFAEAQLRKSIGYSYLARTAAGEVGISVTDEKTPCDASSPVQMRLELSKCEKAVRLLEDWLNVPLDFMPYDKPFSTALIFTLVDAARPSMKVCVHVPKQMWLQSDQSVAELESSDFKITWCEFYAKIIIDQLELSDSDTKAIKSGSTVLLASSFNTNWSPRLSVPGLEMAVVGDIEVPGISWTDHSVVNHIEYTSTTFNDELIGEVVCFCSVTGKDFFDKKLTALQDLLTKKLNKDRWTLNCAGNRKAVGELLPIANGIGLHISQIVDCH